MKIINSLFNDSVLDYSSNFENYINSITDKTNNLYVSTNGIPWIRYEEKSFVRFPIYNLMTPSPDELNELFRINNCFVVSYNISTFNDASEDFIYICRDEDYSISKLSAVVKRNLKKAEKVFEFREVDKTEFFLKGFQCYHDTRKRVGLDDYDLRDFQNSFNEWSKSNSNKIFAAVINNRIAAFISATEIGNFVEIGSYSCNEFLSYRPNDFLVYHVLHHYLVNQKVDFVSFGLSSIQSNKKEYGLHQFKLKTGFEAFPVKRIFKINPKYQFLNSRISYALIKALLKLSPHDRRLKKIEGVLKRMVR